MLRTLWERSVWSTRLAIIPAIIGWGFRLGGGSSTTVNGQVTECSGLDIGPLLFGVITLALVATGWRQSQRYQPPQPAFNIVSGLLALAGVALLIKFGTDPDGSFCPG